LYLYSMQTVLPWVSVLNQTVLQWLFLSRAVGGWPTTCLCCPTTCLCCPWMYLLCKLYFPRHVFFTLACAVPRSGRVCSTEVCAASWNVGLQQHAKPIDMSVFSRLCCPGCVCFTSSLCCPRKCLFYSSLCFPWTCLS
jgi:hypothetical protein